MYIGGIQQIFKNTNFKDIRKLSYLARTVQYTKCATVQYCPDCNCKDTTINLFLITSQLLFVGMANAEHVVYLLELNSIHSEFSINCFRTAHWTLQFF